MKCSLGIIIQARMGSSRLPAKVLMDFRGKTLLEHIWCRLRRLQTEATVVVATSTHIRDDLIDHFCRRHAVECFRGSENHVLERYYRCAQHYQFPEIVRMTADNPFPDIEELDRLIALHLSEKADFSHSFNALPVGVGLEIFNFESLERSYLEGLEPHHLEHVNEYMLENPQLFKTALLKVDASKNYPEIRLTVDSPEDKRRADYILANSATEYIDTIQAIQLCLRFV